MYFTTDDLIRIEQWLNRRGVKDTEFELTDTLKEGDLLPIVLNMNNKTIPVKDFMHFVNTLTGNLINVSAVFNKYGITLEKAIATVPQKSRRLGLIITFYNEDNKWVMYLYDAADMSYWLNEKYWSTLDGTVNKFKGLFPTDESLKENVKRPFPGDYAFVGESMENAELWVCEELGEWSSTHTKAHSFADLYEAVYSRDFSELDHSIDEDYCDRAEKDSLGRIIHFTYVTREGLSNYVLEKVLNSLSEVDLPEESVSLKHLTQSLKDYIGSAGSVTNMPDEEDLTSELNDDEVRVLKFKDKKYIPTNFSGKGRIYLRKNMTDGINVLEQNMISESDTIYVIQYDYCLNGATITIPNDCVLKFEGGSINGGTIVTNNTTIIGYLDKDDYGINLKIEGTYKDLNNITSDYVDDKVDYVSSKVNLVHSALLDYVDNKVGYIDSKIDDVSNKVDETKVKGVKIIRLEAEFPNAGDPTPSTEGAELYEEFVNQLNEDPNISGDTIKEKMSNVLTVYPLFIVQIIRTRSYYTKIQTFIANTNTRNTYLTFIEPYTNVTLRINDNTEEFEYLDEDSFTKILNRISALEIKVAELEENNPSNPEVPIQPINNVDGDNQSNE